MREFDIINFKTEYEYTVLATSYVNPLDKLYDIEEMFRNINFCGKVLFDLLFCNGFSYNRFLEIYFNGGMFDRNSIRIISSPSSETQNKIYRYYEKNVDYLEDSVLPGAQKYLIKNGLLYDEPSNVL